MRTEPFSPLPPPSGADGPNGQLPQPARRLQFVDAEEPRCERDDAISERSTGERCRAGELEMRTAVEKTASASEDRWAGGSRGRERPNGSSRAKLDTGADNVSVSEGAVERRESNTSGAVNINRMMARDFWRIVFSMRACRHSPTL